MSKQMKRLSFGWTLALVLFILYVFFKMQGWWYAFQTIRLSEQIVELRPAVSAILRSEQIKATGAAYEKAFQQVQTDSLDAVPFLQQLSSRIPASMTLSSVDLDEGMGGFTLEGIVDAGGRSPEEALLPWARRLQRLQTEVRIRKLFPDSRGPGFWRFELRSQRVNP